MIMQTENDNQNIGFNNPEWYFLAEYPLNEFKLDMDTAGVTGTRWPFQSINDLCVDPALLFNIKGKLFGIARDTIAQFHAGCTESPVFVRFFCQKKILDGVNSAKSLNQFTAEETHEPAQGIRHQNGKVNGGWGYFLVERGGVSRPGASGNTHYCVDVYLYKEGE